MEQTKKITRATFKSFIKKNADKLFIRKESRFDGMIDGMSYDRDAQFVPAGKSEINIEHTLGVNGVWLVLDSRDYFARYEDASFVGFKVLNCCGSFVLATAK